MGIQKPHPNMKGLCKAEQQASGENESYPLILAKSAPCCMSFRARFAKGCPIYSTMCSCMAPKRTHRPELGTGTCFLILCAQSWYLNMPSKTTNTLQGELPHGNRGNSQTQERAFVLHLSEEVMNCFGTVCELPFIWESKSQIALSSCPRPTCLNAAVKI